MPPPLPRSPPPPPRAASPVTGLADPLPAPVTCWQPAHLREGLELSYAARSAAGGTDAPNNAAPSPGGPESRTEPDPLWPQKGSKPARTPGRLRAARSAPSSILRAAAAGRLRVPGPPPAGRCARGGGGECPRAGGAGPGGSWAPSPGRFGALPSRGLSALWSRGDGGRPPVSRVVFHATSFAISMLEGQSHGEAF